jgi:hypothetical protein
MLNVFYLGNYWEVKKNYYPYINEVHAWYTSSKYLLLYKFNTNCQQEMEYLNSGLQDKVFDTTEGHNSQCDNRMILSFLKYSGGLKLCHTQTQHCCM